MLVTLIVLLILAGVSIAILTGENGIIKQATEAKENSKEAEAREKLEIFLENAKIEKRINERYNQEEFLNKLIIKDVPEALIMEDTIIVDGYIFELDRSILKIGKSLGKGQLSDKIKIELKIIETDNDTRATLGIQIIYEGEISEIIIRGEKIGVPTPVNGKYTVEKEVAENGIYTVIVKDKDGNYKSEKIEINNLAENMDIWNKADMDSFRDKVNEGKTFEGRIVKVMDNIDLKNEEWTPIANYVTNNLLIFKGTFEGNNKTISNFYINSTEEYRGLFGYNEGEIRNIIIEGNVNSSVGKCGGITAYNGINGEINGCINKVTISAGGDTVGGITGANGGLISNCGNIVDVTGLSYSGGIVGMNSCIDNKGGEIRGCYNTGKITSTRYCNSGYAQAGGIVGHASWGGVILNCYNTGDITGEYGESGGIVGCIYTGPTNIVSNCYNIGNVSNNRRNGSISGQNRYADISNCYWTTSLNGIGHNAGYVVTNNFGKVTEETLRTYANILGDEFVEDKNGINEGFPILAWQLEK
ncbi:MAG: hypothetical protein HFJ55_00990 [Clostridia bacterium]|nr:hypothetical protein [Clostridia bacterium]